MNPTLLPNPTAVGVPVLTVEDGELVATWRGGRWSHPLAEVSLVTCSYRIRNSQTSGLTRDNVLVEDRAGQPLAWLGNLDVAPYLPSALAEFADAVGVPLVQRGEVPFSTVSALPDHVRIGPGTSRAGQLAAPARQWILCLALIGGAGPLVLVAVEDWSRWWWLLLVPLWFFGSFFVIGIGEGKARRDDAGWVRRTRLGTALVALVTVLGVAVGASGYDGGQSAVPGWLGLWVAFAGMVLLASGLNGLRGTWVRGGQGGMTRAK